MNDNIISVKEYAAIRKCSESAVYKRLRSPSNKIRKYVVVIDDKTYLKRQILEDEKATIEPIHQPVENDTKPVQNGSVQKDRTGSEAIDLAIEALKSQLDVKDQQILKLQDELALAHQHEREIADRLTILLKQSQDMALLGKGTEPIEPAEPTTELEFKTTPMPEPEQKPKKKSLWKRLFGG